MSEESRLVEGEEVGTLGKNESEEEEKELSVGKPEIEKSVKCELMSPDRNALPCNKPKRGQVFGKCKLFYATDVLQATWCVCRLLAVPPPLS